MVTKSRATVPATERRDIDLTATRRSFFEQPARPRQAAGYVVAIAGIAALTAAFRPFRASLTPLSEGFAYLTLVVAVAWIGGLGPGILASVLAFVTFNFFFLPPYDTFVIERPEYIVVLFVQLGISVLISMLLGRTRERAAAAELREAELRALQELSEELVGRVPGKEAYEAVLSRLTSLLRFDSASLLALDDEGALKVEASAGAQQQPPDASATGSPERVPLSVGRRNLGMLVMGGDRAPLGPGESRVLRAFCDQLALVLERDRLLRVAAKAESYRAAEKLRRALLTAVSHDLRSPLSTIKASVTDLLDEDSPPGAAYIREVLTSVDSEVDRLNGLIANLLDMSRIEAGMLRAKVREVDVRELVQHVADVLQRRWPKVRFDIAFDEGAHLVRGDPVFLDRVLTNLLENAARATQETDGGDVRIEARTDDDRAQVRVIDHGKGVPASLREHLFHPFYALDERSARLGPGLGLAICKGFLDAMDGAIWAEDTPGGGATLAFSVAVGGAA